MLDAHSIIDYQYEEFVQGINRIADAIRDSEWAPDYIVGIVRGGCVPATYLSHALKLPMITVQWNTRDSTVHGNETNTIIPEDLLEGKKVLIVDDIVDGGETIKEVIDSWQRSVRDDLPLENIRVAAMFYNTAQDVVVDYCDQFINRNEDPRWVVFPWEG